MTIQHLVRNFILTIGEFFIFVTDTFRVLGRLRKRWPSFIRSCEFVGVSSTGIVVVAAVFVGAVLGYQLYVSFALFGAQAMLGGALGVTVYREMAPFMAALMVTGRAGAAIAAEISSMRVSEQIDALEVMAVDPIEFLVMPRVVAGFTMMPLLAVLFAGVASLSSAGVACGVMGLDYSVYWEQYAKSVDIYELVHLLVKSSIFGFLLSVIACFYGFRAEGGSQAVGLATRTTVVIAMLAILFADYLTTSLLPYQRLLFEVN